MRMKTNLFFGVLLSLLITGCYPLKFKKVKYNDQKEIYEYAINNKQSAILRNDSSQLITKSNIEQFEQELKQNKFRYPFKRRQEKSNVIRNSDLQLASTYSQVSAKILSKDYGQGLVEISSLKGQYPEIVNYSDCLFLEAYCYEQLQKQDSANSRYSDFLNYSSGKYSARFRGYRDRDNKDSLWVVQRNYAKHFLLGQTPIITEDVFKKLNPSYYYSSFHPGYNLNREDLARGVNGYFGYFLGFSMGNYISFGVQTYHKLNDRIDLSFKNGGLVCGLLWSGWEISYDITHSALVFGIDLY